MRAVIDLGTNSVRLLIAENAGSGISPLYRQTLITRLGEGVDSTGCLKEEAVERTLVALGKIAKEIPPNIPVDLVATSAVRDAGNREEFSQLVQRHTGWNLIILSGEDEARLSFRGAIVSVREEIKSGPLSVVDVGGGSTEIYTGTPDGELYGGGSAQLGAVRMLERYITQHPLNDMEKSTLEREVEKILFPLVQENLKFKPKTLIAVGGTATTIGALVQELVEFDHHLVNGFVLSGDKLLSQYEKLGKLSLGERSQIPTLQSGREDIIISGVAILVKVVEMMGFHRLIVSIGDLLYGWLKFVVDEW